MKRSNLKTRFCLLGGERRLFTGENVERIRLKTQLHGDVNRKRRGAEVSFKNNSRQKICEFPVVFCIVQKFFFVAKGNHCKRMKVLRLGLLN